MNSENLLTQEYVLWNAVSVPLLQFARYCSIIQTLSLKYPGHDLDLEVTWRRRSLDHTIRYIQFPMCYSCSRGDHSIDRWKQDASWKKLGSKISQMRAEMPPRRTVMSLLWVSSDACMEIISMAPRPPSCIWGDCFAAVMRMGSERRGKERGREEVRGDLAEGGGCFLMLARWTPWAVPSATSSTYRVCRKKVSLLSFTVAITLSSANPFSLFLHIHTLRN